MNTKFVNLKSAFLCFCVCFFSLFLEAQVCNPKGISTDPFSSVNPQTPTRLNKFDWKSTLTRTAQGPQYYWKIHQNGVQSAWSNPFFSPNEYLKPIAADDKSDFYSQDGWELVKRDLGYLEDEITPRSADPSVYYIILYNRFSGVVRVLANSIGFNTGASFVRVGIKYDNLALDGTSNKIPRLFNFYSTVAKPVDVLDISEKDAMITTYTNSPSVTGNFLYADFQLAYDPCICGIPGDLRFKFSRITEAIVNLSGRVLGTSAPIINTETGQIFGDNLGEDFLTSVYNAGSDPSLDAGVGMMTFSNVKDFVEDYKSKLQSGTPNYDNSTSQALNAFSGMFDLASVVVAEDDPEVSFYFQAISTVMSFFSEDSDPGKPDAEVVQPMPWGIQAEMALKGSCTTDIAQNDIDILVGIPGSLGASTKQELASATVSSHPMYNESLGAFAVLETPQVEMFYQNSVTATDQAYIHVNSDCDYWYEYQVNQQTDIKGFRVAQMPKIVINPTFHPNIPKCSIKAAWGVEHTDGDQYTNVPVGYYSYYLKCTGPNPPSDCGYPYVSDYSFTNMSHYPYTSSFTLLDNYMQQTDKKDNKTTYLSQFVPLEGFDKMMPRFQMGYYNGHRSNHYDNHYTGAFNQNHSCQYHDSEDAPTDFTNPNGGGQFTLYIWLLVRLESTDLNRFGQPNSTTTLLKLPVKISNQITGAANYNSFFANNLPYDYTLGASNITSNTTYKALNSITVNGNVTVGTGSKLILDAGYTVVMAPESVINGELEMNMGKSQLGTPWTPYDASTSVASWCLSKRNITLSANTREDEVFTSDDIQINGMTVFPNPTAFNATMSYSLAENSEVNVYVCDIYGSKVINILSNASQLVGQYSIQVNTYGLVSGAYFCIMEANGQKNVQRLVIVK